jgi:hypothetical protein
MNGQVIQLAHLEELLQGELRAGDVVRVVVLDVTESVSAQVPSLRLTSIGVHVRAVNAAGHILACYLPVAEIQLYNGRREGDPTWQQYDAAWERAEGLKERVVAYLQTAAAEQGFTVRTAGVIDLGGVRPLHGTWLSDPIPTVQVRHQG